MPRKNILYICAAAGAFIAITSYAAFVETSVKNRPVVQVETKTLKDEAPSFLPAGKKWKLVWHDEFNGKEIDKTKWMCRESFWGQDFPAFAHNFEGVEMTGKTVRLHLLRKGDDFCSPHLQTGSLTFDIPKDTKGFWPFGKYRKPLFMHKYGYYEIRCRPPAEKSRLALGILAPSPGCRLVARSVRMRRGNRRHGKLQAIHARADCGRQRLERLRQRLKVVRAFCVGV